MASLLCGSVSPTYSNLSSVAHHRSSWQASKDGRFEDAFNIENALMQQPSHITMLIITRRRRLILEFSDSRLENNKYFPSISTSGAAVWWCPDCGRDNEDQLNLMRSRHLQLYLVTTTTLHWYNPVCSQ